MKITSGYRCPKHPIEAKKAAPGAHSTGLACDIGVSGSEAHQVLLLAMEGLSTKAIAERLYISARTVDKHRANIMDKFQVHSIVELINYIRKNNIL
jgi:DNA-binding NarL/FixJ family response regulator